MSKKSSFNIKISSEELRDKSKKIHNIHEHLQSIKQGVGVQQSKKKYNRNQKHKKGWD